MDSIDSITIDDVKECHKYLLENSRGTITVSMPVSLDKKYKNEILESVKNLNPVQPNIIETLELYRPNKNTKVLTKENSNSQADIMEVFKFKNNDTIKEILTARLMNSILSGSSIGLFDTLREKEHLAYSVYSDINRVGDESEISLNILTTTDNKNIGEINYDNVKKSINGFNRQINELVNGNFTDKDLENAKRYLKASLLINEGADDKLSVLHSGMNSLHGIEYFNKLYNEIDSITKDDITNFAQNVFSSKPIYSIVASKDTLDANKEFFAKLEQN